MTWRFSDGTEVDLGGAVRGDMPLADALRRDVARRLAGESLFVTVLPQPGGDELLDLNDPHHVNQWARNKARIHGVDVLEAPKVTAPQDDRVADAPPGALY